MERAQSDLRWLSFFFSEILTDRRGLWRRNTKEKGSYLSHSLTFLQLLVQQPADIKAVTETEKQEGIKMFCLKVVRATK